MSLKRVVITGVNGALGKIVAKKYMDSGIRVIGMDVVKSTESKSEKMDFMTVDLANSESIRKALQSVQVDALVHCAGGFRYAKVDETSDADLDFLWNANLRSSFCLVRELLPGMKKQNFGRIAFISAKGTLLQGGAGLSAYAASKAGINMLVTSLAEEVKDNNINVNAVLPTIIDTPANRSAMPQSDFSKWVKPEELAEIIYALTTPLGNPIHGALIPVSGRV